MHSTADAATARRACHRWGRITAPKFDHQIQNRIKANHKGQPSRYQSSNQSINHPVNLCSQGASSAYYISPGSLPSVASYALSTYCSRWGLNLQANTNAAIACVTQILWLRCLAVARTCRRQIPCWLLRQPSAKAAVNTRYRPPSGKVGEELGYVLKVSMQDGGCAYTSTSAVLNAAKLSLRNLYSAAVYKVAAQVHCMLTIALTRRTPASVRTHVPS